MWNAIFAFVGDHGFLRRDSPRRSLVSVIYFTHTRPYVGTCTYALTNYTRTACPWYQVLYTLIPAGISRFIGKFKLAVPAFWWAVRISSKTVVSSERVFLYTYYRSKYVSRNNCNTWVKNCKIPGTENVDSIRHWHARAIKRHWTNAFMWIWIHNRGIRFSDRNYGHTENVCQQEYCYSSIKLARTVDKQNNR